MGIIAFEVLGQRAVGSFSRNEEHFFPSKNSMLRAWGNSRPLVELVPLPASAQFLNVFESIFSGMARSIIHGSNYESKDAAVKAINLYFEERNENFKANPRRAGNKIWGKERSTSEFYSSNNCKDPAYR